MGSHASSQKAKDWESVPWVNRGILLCGQLSCGGGVHNGCWGRMSSSATLQCPRPLLAT